MYNLFVSADENSWEGTPFEIDLDGGAPHSVKAELKNGKWVLETSLVELGSKIFIFPKKKSKLISMMKKKELAINRKKIITQKDFSFQLSECNNLVLDKAIPIIGGIDQKKTMDILDIDHLIHDTAGWKRRAGNMVQPWANKNAETSKSIGVNLIYHFQIITAEYSILHQ